MNTSFVKKLLITGGNGQLAQALCHHSLAKNFQIIPCSRLDMDITDTDSITNALVTFSPDIIINTAAFTAVDKAESDIKASVEINHLGTQHLAAACEKQRIPLIHISTDYVFDGAKQNPYQENDVPNPINFYGKTKWLGELAVRELCEQHIILRVSGVFSEYGNNFLKTILRLAQERKELRVVADQITCPTYAGDIAQAIFSIVKQNIERPTHWGTYHYCSAPPVSWYEFAKAIVTYAQNYKKLLVEEINAITTDQYPTAAKRPAYSVFDCTKIQLDFDIPQPSWNEGIQKSIQGIFT